VITGHVEALGAAGSGIGGVDVHLGTRTATTNEQGWYIFDDVAATEHAIVSASADGYVAALESVHIADGAAYHVDLVLIPASDPQTVSGATGGTLTFDGVELTIPAGAFVSASGAAVTGNVSVVVATIDPGESDQAREAFPGTFVGTTTAGTEAPLESFGAVAIEARDGTALLQLASGRSIGLLASIGATATSAAPTSVDFWTLDETTGGWAREGQATREGDSYRASVPHLSWWNFDSLYPDRTTCVRACVHNGAGHAVEGAVVRVNMPAVRAESVGYTDSTGCASVNVRTSIAVHVEATYADGSAVGTDVTTQSLVTTTNVQPSQCQDVGVLTLEPAIAQVMLIWGPAPSDLDSHMTGPSSTSSTGRFHTYYGSRGSQTSEPYCALDTDDTSAFGPEVITLNAVTSGVYRYSVHNYSGQSSHVIEDSGARVVVIVPALARSVSFTPPTANPTNGNLWRVFDLHAEGGQIVDIVSINDLSSTTSSTGPAFDP
jgi:hypothetical protein